MQKDKAIFFGIVGGVILLLIIYSFFLFGSPKRNKTNENDFEAPKSDITLTKYQYNSRVDALTQEKYETPERENPLRYNFLDEPSEEKPDSIADKKIKKESFKKPERMLSAQKKNLPDKQIHQESSGKIEAPREIKPVENAQPESTNVRYSFSSSENHTVNNDQQILKSFENNWAQLDEKTIIRENSYQVFLLENNARISGMLFPANSKLYTKAIVQQDFIDILVHRIKDSNTGLEYPVDMFAINEDRSRGIKYQGHTNRETDKASKNMISETMQHVYRRYDVDGVAEAAGEGLEEITGRDRMEVPIGKGYRLIFVENSSQ